MRYERQFDCIDCGQPARRVLSSHQARRCQPCSARFSAQYIADMSAKRGDAWQRWADGMARAAERARQAS